MDEPEYKVGDRVQQVTEHWLNDSAWGTSDTRFNESPRGIGSTAKVTHVYTDRLHVEWEGTFRSSVIARKSVLPYSVAVIAAEEEQQAINSVMASLLGTHDKHLPQDDDLTAVTIITGTITHGEERCYECGGELPQGSDVVATIGMSRETDDETVRPRCTSCHIDQD